MKPIITALIATAAILTTPTHTHADTTDDAYLATIDGHTIGMTDTEKIAVADIICDLRREGTTDMTIAQALVENRQVEDIFDGGYVVGAAEAAYCPELG